MAYRASPHDSPGFTRNEMLFAGQVALPLHVVMGVPLEGTGGDHAIGRDAEDWVQNLREKLEHVHSVARQHLKRSAEYQRIQYDHRASKKGFEVGQQVWLYDPSKKMGVCPALTSPRKGPFVIIEKLDDLLYKIQKGPRSNPKVVHLNRLFLYEGSENGSLDVTKCMMERSVQFRSYNFDGSNITYISKF